MAQGSAAVPSTELLEWPKKDNRRLLHAVYRVGDLDRTIKYVFFFYTSGVCFSFCSVLMLQCPFFFFWFRFYTECFGMKLLRKRDIPEENYSNAFLGFGPEESHFVMELTYSMFCLKTGTCYRSVCKSIIESPVGLRYTWHVMHKD